MVSDASQMRLSGRFYEASLTDGGIVAKNDTDSGEVPDGAACFPEIPLELGVNPLLLAVLHSVVFLGGSAEEIVNAAAGDEALGSIAGYLERCDGEDRRRILEDLATLRGYAREQGWPKQLTAFLKSFPGDFGIEADT